METNRIYGLMKLLREKPHMALMDHESLSSLINYINGYELSLLDVSSNNENLLTISEWLSRQVNSKFSSSWWAYLLQKYDGSEPDAREAMLDVFESYLNYISKVTS